MIHARPCSFGFTRHASNAAVAPSGAIGPAPVAAHASTPASAEDVRALTEAHHAVLRERERARAFWDGAVAVVMAAAVARFVLGSD